MRFSLQPRCYAVLRSATTSSIRQTAPNCAAPVLVKASAFSTTSADLSGHSRWSKIKHDKGKADARRGQEYSKISREIITAAKFDGADSLRLKSALDLGKKAGMTKASMESAMRRGLGVTKEGVEFQTLTVECLGPASVSMIVDCITENKLRTLQDVKYKIKDGGATTTPTAYLFSRKGKIFLAPRPELVEPKPEIAELFEEVFDKSMEIEGIEDAELSEEGPDGDGPVIEVTTTPELVGVVSRELLATMGDKLKALKVGIDWVPNEDTMVDEGAGQEWDRLADLIDKLEATDDVSEVYTNARWSKAAPAESS